MTYAEIARRRDTMGKRLPMNHRDMGRPSLEAEGHAYSQKFVKWIGDTLEEEQIQLVETFTSIQGEGECLGIRSLFVRSSQCNLRCSWCDTKYSFDPRPGKKHGLPDGHYVSTIDDIVDEAVGDGVTHAVLTGGEPTIQPYLPELVDALQQQGIHVTVETNGTILRPEILHKVDLWSIAPKLHDGSRMTYDAEVMHAYLKAYDPKRTNVQIKWVSTTDQDLDEAFGVMNTWALWKVPMPPIWFHPNGMVPDELYALGCKDLAERVLDRLANPQMDPPLWDLHPTPIIKVGLQYHRLIWGHTLGT